MDSMNAKGKPVSS